MIRSKVSAGQVVRALLCSMIGFSIGYLLLDGNPDSRPEASQSGPDHFRTLGAGYSQSNHGIQFEQVDHRPMRLSGTALDEVHFERWDDDFRLTMEAIEIFNLSPSEVRLIEKAAAEWRRYVHDFEKGRIREYVGSIPFEKDATVFEVPPANESDAYQLMAPFLEASRRAVGDKMRFLGTPFQIGVGDEYRIFVVHREDEEGKIIIERGFMRRRGDVTLAQRMKGRVTIESLEDVPQHLAHLFAIETEGVPETR